MARCRLHATSAYVSSAAVQEQLMQNYDWIWGLEGWREKMKEEMTRESPSGVVHVILR